MLRFVVHDVGRDLHDIGEARACRRERQAKVPHDLLGLRGEVAGTHQVALAVHRDLPGDVNRAGTRRDRHMRISRIFEETVGLRIRDSAHFESPVSCRAARMRPIAHALLL